MDFLRNAKDCTMEKQIPDQKSAIWTVNIRCFNLTNNLVIKVSPNFLFSKFEVN